MSFFDTSGTGWDAAIRDRYDWLKSVVNDFNEERFEVVECVSSGRVEINVVGDLFLMTEEEILKYEFGFITGSCTIWGNNLLSSSGFPDSVMGMVDIHAEKLQEFSKFPSYINNSVFLHCENLQHIGCNNKVQINGTLNITEPKKMEWLMPYDYYGTRDDSLSCEAITINTMSNHPIVNRLINEQINWDDRLSCSKELKVVVGDRDFDLVFKS